MVSSRFTSLNFYKERTGNGFVSIYATNLSLGQYLHNYAIVEVIFYEMYLDVHYALIDQIHFRFDTISYSVDNCCCILRLIKLKSFDKRLIQIAYLHVSDNSMNSASVEDSLFLAP